MKAASKQVRFPSAEEALTGVYIDFEGTMKDPASLVGVLYEAETSLRVEQLVHEEALWPAAEAKSTQKGGTCRIATLVEAGERILDLASDGRTVFAFSQREAQVFRDEIEDGFLGSMVADVIVNVLPIAKAWKTQQFPDVVFEKNPEFPQFGRNTLANFLSLIDVAYPAYLGKHKTAGRIKYVRDQLTAKGSYQAVTKGGKTKWTNVLTKNRLDCEYLRELTVRISNDMD